MALVDMVMGRVKDSSGKLDSDDYSSAVGEALKRYSRVRPWRVMTDLVGNGGHDYALPEEWTPGFSSVEQIEYPLGSIPELYLDNRDYKIYLTPDGEVLRILSASPDATETMRVIFTAPQVEGTFPDNDMDAVANLAAANCLRRLAAASGQTSDPTIQADTVNYRSKADEFRRLADAFEQQYNDHLGIGKDAPVQAATASASEPDNGPVGLVHLNSRVRMTHGRRA